MTEPSPSPVKSAMRTLDIIEFVVARAQPVGASDIATALAIPVSSLSYLLATLVERRYLEREGRAYRAGQGLERLLARKSQVSVEDRVAPLVRSLRVQLNETTSFFVQHGWEIETLVTETSEHALRYATRIGARNPMHAFAAGKAILAALSAPELDRYFQEAPPLKRFTPTTITTEPELRAELDRAQISGTTRTREEHSIGIQGIGHALIIDGKLLGAFSIAIPAVRFDAAMEKRAIELLKRTVALLKS